MEWTTEAIVLSQKPHGESSVILEVMTAQYGRHLGLVKGGRARRLQPTLQAGNFIQATWRARLESQLGIFAVELLSARAASLIGHAVGLFGLQVVTAHLRYLAERDPHPGLFEGAGVLLDHVDNLETAVRLLVRFELALLEELGFGLDLKSCAATGATADLAFVSPKSARAVSRAAGAPYADRLLPLPAFLLTQNLDQTASRDELRSALRLTGYFLDRHVARPRAIPLSPSRDQLLARL